MSSTPRSRNSSRSSVPWRTSPKIQAPTSLSLIVATPQVAPRRTSAVALLPPIAMSSVSDAKSDSIAVQGASHFIQANMEVSRRPHADPESPAKADSEPPLADRNGKQRFRFIFHIYAGFSHSARHVLAVLCLPSNPSILTALFQTSRSPSLHNHPLLLLLRIARAIHRLLVPIPRTQT